MDENTISRQMDYLKNLSEQNITNFSNYQENDENKYLVIFGTRIIERFDEKTKAQEYIDSVPNIAFVLYCP